MKKWIDWAGALAAAVLVLGAAGGVCAADSAAPPAPAVDMDILPPIQFVGGVVGDELYNRLLQAPRFKKMNREVYGSPIELRVYQRVHTTRSNRVGGTVSGLLAATTLGLLPAVMSGEHSIVYDYYVHGVLLTSYSYTRQLSRSSHLWGASDTTQGLGQEGLEWARSTTDLFLKDSAADPKLMQMVTEYRSYFGG